LIEVDEAYIISMDMKSTGNIHINQQ